MPAPTPCPVPVIVFSEGPAAALRGAAASTTDAVHALVTGGRLLPTLEDVGGGAPLALRAPGPRPPPPAAPSRVDVLAFSALHDGGLDRLADTLDWCLSWVQSPARLRLVISPFLPGINDTEPHLAHLFRLAGVHGITRAAVQFVPVDAARMLPREMGMNFVQRSVLQGMIRWSQATREPVVTGRNPEGILLRTARLAQAHGMTLETPYDLASHMRAATLAELAAPPQPFRGRQAMPPRPVHQLRLFRGA